MRFVAGLGAVAELLLAGALWRSCCWPGRRGGKPSGISCCRGAVAKLLQAGNRWHRGQPAGAVKRSSIGKSLPLHGRRCGCIGKPTSAHKKRRARKRPKYLSRAASIYSLAKGQHAMRRGRTAIHRLHAVLACIAGEVADGIHLWHSPPACSAGAVAAAIMQGLQGRLQQMQELRRALGIRQG